MQNDGKPDDNEIDQSFQIPFSCSYDWNYSNNQEKLDRLYKLGKKYNWNADDDIDWDRFHPPEATNLRNTFKCMWSGFPAFDCLPNDEKIMFLQKYHSWSLSQTLHGEQGALLVASQLVSNAPNLDAKLFAASQAFDEARHVEVFKKYILLRFSGLYPISVSLKTLLDRILNDSRWEMKFIGMQLVIENLALAGFNQMKQSTVDPVLLSIIELVARDEARHVAFGIEYLQSFISDLPEEERREWETFALDACVLANENIKPKELWNEYGWNIDLAGRFFAGTKTYKNFSKFMLSRIIPHLSRIGLLNLKSADSREKLGALGYVSAI